MTNQTEDRNARKTGEILLEIRDLHIEGRTDEDVAEDRQRR